MRIPHQHVVAGVVLCCASSVLHASGFGLVENSASGMGNAFAGAAASAEDASGVWFNPATMSELSDKNHVSVATHVIMPNASFTNSASSVNPKLTKGSAAAAQAAMKGSDASTSKDAYVPNFYAVKPINDLPK